MIEQEVCEVTEVTEVCEMRGSPLHLAMLRVLSAAGSALPGAYPPAQVHIALGDSPRMMRAGWATFANSTAEPYHGNCSSETSCGGTEVRWGLSADALSSHAVGSAALFVADAGVAACNPPPPPPTPPPFPLDEFEAFNHGRFCCDQATCAGGHSRFLYEGVDPRQGGVPGSGSDCAWHCLNGYSPDICAFVTIEADGAASYCMNAQYCNATSPFAGVNVTTFRRKTPARPPGPPPPPPPPGPAPPTPPPVPDQVLATDWPAVAALCSFLEYTRSTKGILLTACLLRQCARKWVSHVVDMAPLQPSTRYFGPVWPTPLLLVARLSRDL